MEDKIEVGEYVRTNEGKIFLFGGYFKAGDINSMTDIKGFLYGNQNKCCKKHSKNIIDLIEQGDYVNGYEVLDKYLFNGEKPVLETNGEETNCKCLCDSDIKTIVTKEQFKSVEYKI